MGCSSRAAAAALAIGAALAGCHTSSRVTTIRPGASRPEPVVGGTPRALAATVVIGDDGYLRFVTPLRCPADLMVEVETSETVKVEANLATFVVGVIVTVVGAVALARGLADDQPSSSGWTYLGAGGLAVGLPMAIGPWVGNHEVDRSLGNSELRKGAAEAPCGDRPVSARAASLRVGRLRAWGAVDADGRFAISPFSFVDVFAIGELPALDISADVVGEGGIATIEAVIEASALLGARDAFLAAGGIDARVETLRKVPRVEPGGLRVSRLTLDGQPVLRVVVPLENQGPGDAWQIRAVVSTEHAEIDGRLLYIGHLAPGHSVDAELLIPLSAITDAAVTGSELELAVQLRDAHGTMTETPVRFRGKVLGDVPR